MNTNVQNFLFGVFMTLLVVFTLQFYDQPTPWFIVLVIFIFSYPWKMPSGDIYSLWGGISDENIFSFFAIYQNAKIEAFSIFGILLYQKGHTALQLFGISFYQNANTHAGQWVTICYLQKGGDVVQLFGFAFFQLAKQDVEQIFGISCYQRGSRTVKQHFGIPLWQKVTPTSNKHTMS